MSGNRLISMIDHHNHTTACDVEWLSYLSGGIGEPYRAEPHEMLNPDRARMAQISRVILAHLSQYIHTLETVV